ncbi:MAG TPA: glycoside hydrolase family 16 protein [Bacteroidia bacterium]|nr:glycoside hydrolase family 16 protein [Bacteroidia bacterium]HNT80642.1 glycoside hydrolase family 16 protein [Bacteroidia bacterium]
MRIKLLLLTLIISSLSASCSRLAYVRTFKPHLLHGQPNSIERKGWMLTFQDEFNDKKLDKDKWSTVPYFGLPYHPSHTYQYYCDDCFTFSDSTIFIPVIQQEKKFDTLSIPYGVGLLDNYKVFDQQYGYFEIRCRIPEGPALWPAFWLVSRYAWPPEIDIFEFYTSRHKRKLYSNLHWRSTSKKKKRPNQWKEKEHKLPDPAAQFHVYGCEWNEKEIRWYFDDILIRKQKNDTAEFKYPMHITINNAVQNNEDLKSGNALLPALFEVDYVRAYKATGPRK